jgi:hypothetical protein
MTLALLVTLGLPLGVVVIASFAGALLAPPSLSGERDFMRSQCGCNLRIAWFRPPRRSSGRA